MNEIFKTKQETSTGEPTEPSTGEPKSPSKGEPQEGTTQWYKSQLDKHQADYNKKLSENQMAWEKEKQELFEKFGQLQKQLEEVKPPKQDTLQEPERPAGFNWAEAFTDPESPSGKYWEAKQRFDNRKTQETQNKLNEFLGKLEQAEKIKQQAELKELQKAKTIGAFQANGLSAEESQNLYKIIEGALSAPVEEGAKSFVDLYKAKITKPTKKEKEFEDRRSKREQFLPPGLDGAGEIPPDDDSKKFMSEIGGKKNKDIFKTK